MLSESFIITAKIKWTRIWCCMLCMTAFASSYKGMTYGPWSAQIWSTTHSVHHLIWTTSCSWVWKYNDMYHLAEYHANWGSNDLTLPRNAGQLLVDSFITSEEGLMGIDETSTKDWRDENQIPNTDGIEEIRKVLKWARAESSVSVADRSRCILSNLI